MNEAERNLWRAVLGQAYADAEMTPLNDEAGTLRLEASRAQRYLRADSPLESADLTFVCEAAGVPADRLISWARRHYPLAAKGNFVKPSKNQRRTNGHAGPHSRPNGHAPASTARGGIPGLRDQAASDDARGASLALGASSIHASGTDHDACAEVAPPPSPGTTNGHASVVAAPQKDTEEKQDPIPGGESPLPTNPGEFVEEVHRRVDLFEVWQKLLNSADTKIQQRAVEKMTEMRYKGAAAMAEEPQQIIIDIDSAVARRAAEGARS